MSSESLSPNSVRRDGSVPGAYPFAVRATTSRGSIGMVAVLLLGVIDRQATVTEDSLRYVITQQLADQKRLDNLAEHVEWATYRQEELP